MRREKRVGKKNVACRIRGSMVFLCFIPVFLGAGVLVSGCLAVERKQICFNEACFTVDIADTPEKLRNGLMFRDRLPADQGMLFIFDQDDRWAFWMKNTRIALDILWLDETLTVVHLEQDVPPCQEDPCPSYSPDVPARYVLELNAGTARQSGVGVGNILKMER